MAKVSIHLLFIFLKISEKTYFMEEEVRVKRRETDFIKEHFI